jgi:hypothetical protein
VLSDVGSDNDGLVRLHVGQRGDDVLQRGAFAQALVHRGVGSAPPPGAVVLLGEQRLEQQFLSQPFVGDLDPGVQQQPALRVVQRERQRAVQGRLVLGGDGNQLHRWAIGRSGPALKPGVP